MFLPAFLMAAALSATTPPEADEWRVQRVGYLIATANEDVCARAGKVTGWSGLVVDSLALYPPSARAAMAAKGVTAQPIITYVVPGSAATDARIRAGDVITALNGSPFLNALPSAADYGPMRQLEDAGMDPAMTLTLLRDGTARTLTLHNQTGCASILAVRNSRKTNAQADGRYAEFNRGLIQRAVGDGELAYFVAHEMAHNVLSHGERLNKVKWARSAVLETEVEADRFALLLMKGAGFDPRIAATAWGRIARKGVRGMFSGGSHMNDARRADFLETEAARIAAQ